MSDCAQWVDIGCGNGGISAALADRAGKIVGIDPESWPEWAQMAADRPNLEFREARFDMANEVLPARTFDVAVCNQVYEHVRDPKQLLQNIYRVLRPGGVCYFAGPNLLWPVEPHVFWPFVHWLPRRLAQRMMRACGSRRSAELDAYSATYWTLRRWFRDSGFDTRPALRARIAAELELRNFPALAAAMRHAPRWLIGLLTPISPGFVFVLVRR
jgi:SAM-dependent methyltransferase